MIPKTYMKIENLFVRAVDGPNRGKIIPGKYKREEFKLIRPEFGWKFTEKIHGQNIRIHSYLDFKAPDGAGEMACPSGETRKWAIGGKTNAAQLSSTLIDSINKMMEEINPVLSEKLQEDVIFFGEGYGPGINKGGGYSDEPKFILFDIYNPNTYHWWDWPAVQGFGEAVGFDVVPEIPECYTLTDAANLVRQGFKTLVGKKEAEAEGIVGRACPQLFYFNGGAMQPLRWKLKTGDFPK